MPEIDFNDNEEVRLTDLVFYSGKKDKSDRIFPLSLGRVHFERVHYVQESRSYIMCRSTFVRKDRTVTADCCKLIGEPTTRWGMPILVYQTDANGKIQGDSYSIQIWIFSAAVFKKLRGIWEEYGAKDHDLKLTCTDENFKKYDILPTPNVYFRSKPELEKEIISAFETFPFRELSKNKRFFGRELSEVDFTNLMEELMDKRQVESDDENLESTTAPTMTKVAPPKSFEELDSMTEKLSKESE